MLHLPYRRTALLALLVIPVAVALAPASGAAAPAGPPPCCPGGAAAVRVAAHDVTPAAAALAYLRARARSLLGGGQTRALAAHCVPGSQLARHEATLAAGARRLNAALGHATAAISCRVTLGAVRVCPAGGTATVAAHVVTLDTWTDRQGRSNTEGEGLDHVLTLVQSGGRWLVAHDAYSSDLTPRLLQAAGAPAAAVRAAATRLETLTRSLPPMASPAAPLVDAPPAGAPLAPQTRLGYVAQLSFDRDAAKAYADKYALSYNPTYTSFSADCANFGSQTMFAGGYPQFGEHVRLGLVVRQERHERAWQRLLQSRLDCGRQPAGGLERQVHRRRLLHQRRRQGRLRLLRLDRRRHVGPRGRAGRHQHRRTEGRRRPHHRPLPHLLEARHLRHALPVRPHTRHRRRVTGAGGGPA